MAHHPCCRGYKGLLIQAVKPARSSYAFPGRPATTTTSPLVMASVTAARSASQSLQSSSFHTSAFRNNTRSNMNLYECLGVSQNASKREIKSQFYRLSKLHHPDRNASEESRRQFLTINEAYSILGNDRHRRDYDLTLLDKSGSLYSSSSSSSSQRSQPMRGTLRRTPFRHSAQSAAAAAAAAAASASARSHAAFRPNTVGRSVPHFDSKSHQDMHYEQEMRREQRRQARERADQEYKRQQGIYEESSSPFSKFLRVSFLLLMIMAATSVVKVFADEQERVHHDDDGDDDNDDRKEENQVDRKECYLDRDQDGDDLEQVESDLENPLSRSSSRLEPDALTVQI